MVLRPCFPLFVGLFEGCALTDPKSSLLPVRAGGRSALGAQARYGGREDYYVSGTTFPQQLRDKNTQVQSM